MWCPPETMLILVNILKIHYIKATTFNRPEMFHLTINSWCLELKLAATAAENDNTNLILTWLHVTFPQKYKKARFEGAILPKILVF